MNIQDTTTIAHEEIIEKYGDVELKFDYFYKFIFYYEGFAEDGTRISVAIAGDRKEVYRLEFFTAAQTLASLIAQGGELCDVSRTEAG